jgi:putative iron-dependent peroxidase
VGFQVPGADLACVTSIRSAAWDRLFAGFFDALPEPARADAEAQEPEPACPGGSLGIGTLRRARPDPAGTGA